MHPLQRVTLAALLVLLAVRTLSAEPVTLYADPQLQGVAVELSAGIYGPESLGSVGDNNVSSLRVPENLIVRLSGNDDGSGWNWLFRPGNHTEIGGVLDNEASRVEVLPLVTNQLQDVIDAALANGEASLTLQANARYEISDTLHIKAAKSFTLDGANARIVCTNPRIDAINLRGCVGVTLKRFSIDYDPLPFTQGRIVSVDCDAGYAHMKVDPGYSTDASLYEAVPEINGLNRWDPETRRLRRDVSKHFIGSALPGAKGVLRLPDPSLSAGDVVSLHCPWRGVALRLIDCGSCRLEDVAVWAAPGGAFYGTSGDGGHVLDRCRVTRGPTYYGQELRLLSANRDAFHFSGMKRGPIIEGCLSEFHSDDAVNIHGFFRRVIDSTNGLVKLSPGHRVTVGEKLSIHSPGQYLLKATVQVAELGDTSDWIRLNDADVSAVGDHVALVERQGDGAVIRNNTFRDNEARGILCRASSTVIENNVIERTTMSGIWIGPEIGHYREPGFPNDVIVRGNILRDIGISPRATYWKERLLGAITIVAGVDTPEQEQAIRGNRLIKNIVIHDNRVERCAAAGLLVANASEITIYGNTFAATNSETPGDLGRLYGELSPQYAVIVHDAKNVHGNDNRIVSPGAYFSGGLHVSRAAETGSVSLGLGESKRSVD